jgi:anti-anti-sigma regulatory factor
MTLRIERSARQGVTVFTLTGRIKAEQVAELKRLFDTDYRNIILDLRDVRLADRDAVKSGLRSEWREA